MKRDEAIAKIEEIADALFSDSHICEANRQVFLGALTTLESKGQDIAATFFDKAAAGDPNADWVLRFEAANALLAGQELPAPLATYIAGKLLESLFNRPPGKGDPYRNAPRNAFITKMVPVLVAAGFAPTRNRARHETGDRDSACSLIARILKRHNLSISESAVETVWTDFVGQ
jgi:hypothetical protein